MNLVMDYFIWKVREKEVLRISFLFLVFVVVVVVEDEVGLFCVYGLGLKIFLGIGLF